MELEKQLLEEETHVHQPTVPRLRRCRLPVSECGHSAPGVHDKGRGFVTPRSSIMASRTAGVFRHVIRSIAYADRIALTDRELLRRFVEENDQAAFAALVSRHTGMVLGVCRRALANAQDAEDACQAVFLILAQKAKRGRWQLSIANWLYATGRNVARNTRVVAQRRTKWEGRAAVPETMQLVDEITGRELLMV